MKFTLTWAIDDQNLKSKRPTSIIQNISKKIQANSRRYLSMELLLCKIKDHLYVLPRIISKMSYLLQFQVIVSMLVLPKMTVKVLLWMTVMLIKFKETISIKILKMVKLSFDLLVVLTPSNWTSISYVYERMINPMLSLFM